MGKSQPYAVRLTNPFGVAISAIEPEKQRPKNLTSPEDILTKAVSWAELDSGKRY
jgi:hypothetical protein